MRPLIKRNKERFLAGVKRFIRNPAGKALLALTLISYCCFLFVYNSWRSPENVYEEMYWSAIDSSSVSAATMQGGLYYPEDYLPAFLNIFKCSNITDMGAKWNSGDMVAVDRYSNGDYVWADKNGFQGYFLNSYYGRYVYECDERWELTSGKHVSLKLIEITREGSRSSSRALLFRFILMNEANNAESSIFQSKEKIGPTVYAKSLPPEYAVAKYDFESKKISASIQHCAHIDDDESIELLKRVISDVLLGGYFASNPDSAFNQKESGTWDWGEFTFEKVSMFDPEKDHS